MNDQKRKEEYEATRESNGNVGARKARDKEAEMGRRGKVRELEGRDGRRESWRRTAGTSNRERQ